MGKIRPWLVAVVIQFTFYHPKFMGIFGPYSHNKSCLRRNFFDRDSSTEITPLFDLVELIFGRKMKYTVQLTSLVLAENSQQGVIWHSGMW